MRTEVFLPNEWLSVDICAPVSDKIYLVKCKDRYVSTGWYTGGENGYWWVYDRNRHEHHPNPESAPVLWFAELPTAGIFSGGPHEECSLRSLMDNVSYEPCPFCGDTHPSHKPDCALISYLNGDAITIQEWNNRPIENSLRARIKELEQEIYSTNQVCNIALTANDELMRVIATTDPMKRKYVDGLPELECIWCGATRQRFELKERHADDCVWALAQRPEYKGVR